MESSLHETKEIRWDYDEDDNGDVVEFVIIDDEKYIDVSYFNQKLKEKDERFELHKNTDAKTIQDQSDLIDVLNKALELACEELDDAKDMLRECDKNEWASMLDTSTDYFIARAKEIKSEQRST